MLKNMNLYNKQLYNTIINDIAKVVKTELNEMSKNISFRTIDRNTWLSVASTISKNRSTDAEFIKPMKKLTTDELLQRYVAALLITKKQCPKSQKDIENLKTYKLYALKALENGASISDIKDLYNQNNNAIKSQVKQTKVSKVSTDKPIKTNTKIVDKKFNLIENFIQNLPSSKWNKLSSIYSYNLNSNECFSLCKSNIETYLKNIIKKSHNSIEKFGKFIQNDFKCMLKIVPDIKNYINVQETCGYVSYRYNIYRKIFVIIINENNIDMYIKKSSESFSNNNTYIEKYEDNNLFNNITNYIPNTYINEDKKSINLLQSFSIEIFNNIIIPYIKYKQENMFSNNKLNISTILKKYNMSETGTGNFNWLKNNIHDILYNNPDLKINVDYSDWSGGINYIYYNSDYSKYYIDIWCESSNSDHSSTDYLNNLLTSTNSYKYKKNNYTCHVTNLNKLSNNIYKNILDLIQQGKIQ